MAKQEKYPAEVRERAVRLVFESEKDYESQWAATSSIAAKMACAPQTLHNG